VGGKAWGAAATVHAVSRFQLPTPALPRKGGGSFYTDSKGERLKTRGGWSSAVALGVLIIGCLLAAPALAAVSAYEFTDPADEARFRRLIEELRCPKCQNQTIADSNAPLSEDLRERVYAMIQQGRSDGEIVEFMVARYGDFITYRPPLKPVTWPLWFGPLLLTALGGLGLVIWVRRRQRQTSPSLSEQDRARLQALLKETGEEPRR